MQGSECQHIEKKEKKGDRDDAHEITSLWKCIFHRKSLSPRIISEGRRGEDFFYLYPFMSN